MPSFSARLVSTMLRWTGSISKNFAGGPGMDAIITAARNAPLPLPTAKMHRQLDVREEAFAGRAVWHLSPKDRAPVGHMLYFHGGGYVYSAADPHWSALADLAGKYGIAVTAPLYPLAPEHSATEITAFALNAYRHFLDAHDGPFTLGGDSAGAGLAAATVMAARDAGLRLPSNLLLICPWLDVSGTHPDQPAIEKRDAILRIQGLRDAGLLYARDLPISDWRVSPIHGDWTGLPPIMMFAGGDDVLVCDARALNAKLPGCDYDEQAGMIHDWPLFFFPESKAARARMGGMIAAAS